MAVPVVIDISTQPGETVGTGSTVDITVTLQGTVTDKGGADIQLSQAGKGSLSGLPATIHVDQGAVMASLNAQGGSTGACTLAATNGSQPAPATHGVTVT